MIDHLVLCCNLLEVSIWFKDNVCFGLLFLCINQIVHRV